MAIKKSGKAKLLLDGEVVGEVSDLQIKKHEGNITIEYPDGTISELSTEVKPPAGYQGPTANVGMSMGFTKNIGNYENVKAQVSLNMPCYPKELEDIMEFTKDWVDDNLTKIKEEIEEGLGK